MLENGGKFLKFFFYFGIYTMIQLKEELFQHFSRVAILFKNAGKKKILMKIGHI